MSTSACIRVALDGAEFQKGESAIECSDPKKELTDIVRFSMRLPFSGRLFRNQCNAIEIELERIAETHEDNEGLACKYLFGEQGRGDSWVVDAQVAVLNPNAPTNDAMQGVFKIEKAQIVDVVLSDDAAGPPRETVRIVGTGVTYEEKARGDGSCWDVPFEVPNF